MGHVLTTKDAAMEAFRRPEVFSSAATFATLAMGSVRPLIPLQIDPPDHLKYRKILDPLFAPRQMAALDESVATLVNDLIDGFVDRGEVDFAKEFSVPLPSQVFLTLLGLPLSDVDLFLKMKDGIIRPDHVTGTSFDSDEAKAHQRATATSIYEYFETLLDERGTSRGDDLLTELLDAEVDGDRLSREDILDICFLFLIAGLDTVSDTLTCSYAYLAQHPEHRRQLVEDPDLIPSAVEELLRWESPVPNGVPRVATQDVELPNGVKVTEGTAMMVSYGAANVDPVEFPDAFEVRFDREQNRHIAFGGGVHRCLGSHLARRELRITLREWHQRIPDYRIKPGHEELVYPPGLRSVQHLTLVWPT